MLKVVINVELIKHIVEVIDVELVPLDINLETILKVVSTVLGIPIVDIKSKCKKKELADARKCYCYLARKYTRKSLARVGQLIRCDHVTVLCSVRKAEYFIKNEIEFKNACESVIDILSLR